MYSFDDGGGRSLTLRPEGTAPVCRAYLEHGMHKLPQPVKLWYLSSFFRAEAPQRGRYRQFWQVGAEMIGSAAPEADAELILLLAELLEAMGVREPRLRISSLGTPATRAAYREELTAFLRAHEDGLSPEVVARIDLNPLRAFDSDDARTRETMRSAPLLLDRLEADDAEHFAAVRACLDGQELPYEVDPTLVRGLDYYTRTLYRVRIQRPGRPVGAGRRRPLRRADRAARGQADAGHRMGGRDRAHPARRARRPRPRAGRGSVRRPGHARGRRRLPSAWPPRRAGRDWPPRPSSPGARSRASSSRATGSAPATWRSSPTSR